MLARIKITMRDGDQAKTDKRWDSYRQRIEGENGGMAEPGSVVELDPIEACPGWYSDRSLVSFSYHESWLEFWLPMKRDEVKPEGYQCKFDPRGWDVGQDVGGIVHGWEDESRYRRPVTMADAIVTKPEKLVEKVDKKKDHSVYVCTALSKIKCSDQGATIDDIGPICLGRSSECRLAALYKLTPLLPF